MKKLFLIITLILFSGIATADCIVSTSDPGGNYTAIMSLIPVSSSTPLTNSHGAINVGTYTNKLYCEPPITAGSTTKLIGLHDTINSHAEAPIAIPTYLEDVTIDGVGSCYSTTNANCNATGDIKVLSLFALTNSHIGAFGDYPIKICCSTSAPEPVDSCTVENTTTSINVGGTTTYNLSCLGSSGPTNCTSATWNSTSTGVAEIDSISGLARGVSVGITNIGATIDAGSLGCTQKPLTVTTTPVDSCISEGGTCATNCTPPAEENLSFNCSSPTDKCCITPTTPIVPGDYVKITIETNKENYQQGQTPTADYITPTVTITKLQDFVTDATFKVTLGSTIISPSPVDFSSGPIERITLAEIDPETLSASGHELVAEITSVTTSPAQPSEVILGNNINSARFTVQDESGNTATPEIPFALIVFVAISAIMLISRENK